MNDPSASLLPAEPAVTTTETGEPKYEIVGMGLVGYMSIEAVLDRIEKGAATPADIEQLRKWLYPNFETLITKAFFVLLCYPRLVRQTLGAESLNALARTFLEG